MMFFYPFDDAMKMKNMIALAPHRWAVISRYFAIRATGLERSSAARTTIVVHIPSPCGNAVVPFNLDLHCVVTKKTLQPPKHR